MVTIASRLTGVPEADIVGHRRQLHLCAIRSAIYELAVNHGYSYCEIGHRIGGRDHSTVINGFQNQERFSRYIGLFPEFQQMLMIYASTLDPFVRETDWTPPVTFKVRKSSDLRRERNQRASILRSLEPLPAGHSAPEARLSQQAGSDRLREAIALAA